MRHIGMFALITTINCNKQIRKKCLSRVAVTVWGASGNDPLARIIIIIIIIIIIMATVVDGHDHRCDRGHHRIIFIIHRHNFFHLRFLPQCLCMSSHGEV